MKYLIVECGNNYCGCDEEYLLAVDDNATDEEIAEYIYDTYSYQTGAAGLRIGDGEEDDITSEEYDENIYDNMRWDEITKEEFDRLKEEECFEVR